MYLIFETCMRSRQSDGGTRWNSSGSKLTGQTSDHAVASGETEQDWIVGDCHPSASSRESSGDGRRRRLFRVQMRRADLRARRKFLVSGKLGTNRREYWVKRTMQKTVLITTMTVTRKKRR